MKKTNLKDMKSYSSARFLFHLLTTFVPTTDLNDVANFLKFVDALLGLTFPLLNSPRPS